jgi:hypothetical protein
LAGADGSRRENRRLPIAGPRPYSRARRRRGLHGRHRRPPAPSASVNNLAGGEDGDVVEHGHAAIAEAWGSPPSGKSATTEAAPRACATTMVDVLVRSTSDRSSSWPARPTWCQPNPRSQH